MFSPRNSHIYLDIGHNIDTLDTLLTRWIYSIQEQKESTTVLAHED